MDRERKQTGLLLPMALTPASRLRSASHAPFTRKRARSWGGRLSSQFAVWFLSVSLSLPNPSRSELFCVLDPRSRSPWRVCFIFEESESRRHSNFFLSDGSWVARSSIPLPGARSPWHVRVLFVCAAGRGPGFVPQFPGGPCAPLGWSGSLCASSRLSPWVWPVRGSNGSVRWSIL